MKPEEFWEIVDAAATDAREHRSTPAEALRGRLESLRNGELRDFDRNVERFASRAGASDLWAATFLLPDAASDDGFLDLCTWLVSQGRQTYEAILADPDHLADIDSLDDQLEHAEEWSYVAEEILDERGAHPSHEVDAIPEPAREPLTGEHLARLPEQFPRLWARYGWLENH